MAWIKTCIGKQEETFTGKKRISFDQTLTHRYFRIQLYLGEIAFRVRPEIRYRNIVGFLEKNSQLPVSKFRPEVEKFELTSSLALNNLIFRILQTARQVMILTI